MLLCETLKQASIPHIGSSCLSCLVLLQCNVTAMTNDTHTHIIVIRREKSSHAYSAHFSVVHSKDLQRIYSTNRIQNNSL
ncbi:Sporulation protein [Dirofilaria immitis]